MSDSERSAYNRALDDQPTPARRSGWRRSIEQKVRFEAVVSRWEPGSVDSVLDLGCGAGELCGWLSKTGREVRYTGVDLRESMVNEARRRHPDGRFLVGDFFEDHVALEGHDVVVAVGALVDGRPVDDDRQRRARVGRLVRRVFGLAEGGAVMDVLDQQVVEERVSLRLEPALVGAHIAELRAAVPQDVEAAQIDGRLLGRDWMVWGSRRAGGPLVGDRLEATPLIERTLSAVGADAREAAWIWLEAGARDRAAAILEGIDGGGEAVAHLRGRLRAMAGNSEA